MSVLPMGTCFAPCLAQHVTNHLCRIAQHRCPGAGLVRCWVDNFIILAHTFENCQTLLVKLVAVCSEVSLQLKPAQSPTTCMDIIGLRFELTQAAVFPTSISQSKIAAACDILMQSTDVNHFQFAHWLGLAVWHNYCILRSALCHFPVIMEAARELGRIHDLRARIDLTSSLKREVLQLSSATLAAVYKPRTPSGYALTTPPPSTPIIASDAAPNFGIGVVFGEQWAALQIHFAPNRIFLAEMSGPMLAAAVWQVTDEPWAWQSDNMACVRAFTRGHSGNAAADNILRHLIQTKKAPTWIGWVPSECMPADPISRGLLSPQPWCDCHKQVQRRRFEI